MCSKSESIKGTACKTGSTSPTTTTTMTRMSASKARHGGACEGAHLQSQRIPGQPGLQDFQSYLLMPDLKPKKVGRWEERTGWGRSGDGNRGDETGEMKGISTGRENGVGWRASLG